MTIKFYKVKDTVTGLYSSGGSWVSWNQEGKEWSKRGHILSHISSVVGYKNAGNVYKNAVIVEYEYEYNPVVVSETRLFDIIEEKNRKDEEAKQREKIAQENLEYKRAKELVQKYESKA